MKKRKIFPWGKKRRKQKDPADIRELSKRLVAKQMRNDPEFGLQVAMRELKYEQEPVYEPEEGGVEEKRPVREIVRDVKDILGLAEELKPGSGTGGPIWSQLINSIGQGVGQTLGQALEPMAKKLLVQIQQQQTGQPQQQIQQQQQLSQAEQPQLTKPPQPKLPETTETINVPHLDELMPYLEEEPQDIIAMLKERREAGDTQAELWLKLLSKGSYKQVCALLRSLQEQNPQLESLLADLLHENREQWWRALLKTAQEA